MREVKVDFVQDEQGVRFYRLIVDGQLMLRRATMAVILKQIGELDRLEEACRAAIL